MKTTELRNIIKEAIREMSEDAAMKMKKQSAMKMAKKGLESYGGGGSSYGRMKK